MASKAIRIVVKGSNGMETKTIKLSRKIKNFDGSEVTRKGVLNISRPNSNEEASLLFGANMWKWALHGYIAQARSFGVNNLTGAKGKDIKSLLRDFKQAHATLTDPQIMGFEKKEAYEALLGKEKFKPLVGYFENLKKSDEVTMLDLTGEHAPTAEELEVIARNEKLDKDKQISVREDCLPTPRWFTKDGEEIGESDDEDDSDDSE